VLHARSVMDERETTVWQGKTPTGFPIVLERDERERWIATVAGTMRSRHQSVAIAVAEAAGLRTQDQWVRAVAAHALSRTP
jgi:hypothetical protein